MFLYIHIPFCVSKCDYCDFFSVPCKNKISNDYIEAVISEAEYKSQKYQVKEWDTIYIGGGTPSLLSAEQLDYLISSIKIIANKTKPKEVTVEMNPESITIEKLEALQKAGATRLSIGIQSLSENALQNVHRHCSSKITIEALDIVKSLWHGQLNVDVIAGLPKQTEDEYLNTIKKLFSYSPNHFSLYTLTIEDGTPLQKRIANGEIYNSDEADRLWLLGRDLLEENGYAQYEVSNFAKDKCQSVHNMAYWNQKDYVGLGAGACGTVYNFTGKCGIRHTNTTDIKKYVDFWLNYKKNGFLKEDLPFQTEELSLKTEEFEYLMMGLRTIYGVSSCAYKKKFSSLPPYFGDLHKRMFNTDGVYDEFYKKSYLKVHNNIHDNTIYRLTKDGILLLNTFLMAFI